MTAIIEYAHNNITRDLVRNGRVGSYDVLSKMIELTRSSVMLDKGLEDFLKHTLIENGLNSHSKPAAIFTLIYDYTKRHISYIQDIAGAVETIKDARTTLQDGFGDCDDIAIFIATWLAMLGYEPSFTIAKYDATYNAPFQHVYTTLTVNGERFVFDTTLPNGKLNSEAAFISSDEVGVFDYNVSVDGVSGTLRGFRNLAKDTAQNGLEAISALASFLPLGFIPSHALSLGTALFSGIQNGERSLSAVASKVSSILTDTIIELQNGRLALEVAQSRARKAMASFYERALRGDSDANAKLLRKTLEQKYNYINSYGTYGDASTVTGLNTNLMLIAGVAMLGVGAYILFNRAG